ncbi:MULTISPECIES: radical SAM protein [unclassified Neptuniibacter]|uniref:radical SAM protein n=1 Tax=unclassified Neptuniibacter TaxID=2630693 RepID=UPI0025F76C61|nr:MULTISPECIES: radical SAM protein [unclassified Neptuniibacter]
MNIFERITKQKVPVIIFGAGYAGQVILNTCIDHNVEIAAFCDNKKNYSGQFMLGHRIIHSSELHDLFPEAIFIISAADINDVVIQLNDLHYSQWHAGGDILKFAEIGKHKYDTEFSFLDYAVSTCIQCHDAYQSPDKLFLRSVDIVITEKCSMRCKDCSNLMQYYEKPVNYDAAELTASLESFFSHIDQVNEFRVIGGEPFMNKHISETIDWLNNQEKVGRVIIYTNGTILPKGQTLECLKNKKVMMMITDYDELSKNHDRLIGTLDEHNIEYHTDKAQNWTDCASIKEHNRSIESQKEVFKNCCAKCLFTIMDGKFYRCPFSAHVDKLRATPLYEDDYVDLLSSSKELGHKIKEFIFNKDYLNSCDYCVGRFLSDKKITPGIQVSEPLKFKQYS